MREKEKSTQIIFVRHGQPDFSIDRLYCDDREDPELTEQGRMHARFAATSLSEQKIAAIYASPLQRAAQTAAPISEALGLPVTYIPELKERPFGKWDGMYFSEVEAQYPDEYLAWKKDKINYVPEGGETIDDCVTRVSDAVALLIKRHHGECIIVVAHVGPIRLLVSHAIGLPVVNYRSIQVDYGSLTRIDYGRRQNNLIYLNRGLSPLANPD